MWGKFPIILQAYLFACQKKKFKIMAQMKLNISIIIFWQKRNTNLVFFEKNNINKNGSITKNYLVFSNLVIFILKFAHCAFHTPLEQPSFENGELKGGLIQWRRTDRTFAISGKMVFFSSQLASQPVDQ